MTSNSEGFVVVENEGELQRVLDEASRADRGVLLSGGLDEPFRRDGEDDHLAIGLGRLDALVAFEPDDLTITAQAGMKVERLMEIAAEKHQRLAIELADPSGRSLGGAVALNEDGFIAALYGELREQVLGLRSITGDGRLLRAGGRVVKNVTGYDLRKLLCGSMGRLAAITELSFRLRPRAVAEASFVLAGFDRDGVVAQARRLRELPIKTSGIALRRDANGYMIALRAEGAPATLDELGSELNSFTSLDEPRSRALWRELVGIAGPRLLLRHRPSQLAALLDLIPEGAPLIADLAAGRVRLPCLAGEPKEALLERTKVIWSDPGLELLVVLEDESGPLGFESDAAQPRSADGKSALEARIRRVFDPRGVMMRGRSGAGLP